MAQRTRSTLADPKLAVGLIRRSTGKQDISPEAQLDELQKWCARTGRVLVAHVVETVSGGTDLYDEDAAGGLDLERRPELLRAIDLLKTHGAGVLAAYKRDRFARDPLAMALVERLVQRNGARLMSTAGEGTEADPNDPTAKLVRGMLDLLSAYELALIRQRTRLALAAKRRRGERVGDVRLGFRLADDGRTEVEDEREQRAIALARRLRSEEGLSLREVGARLVGLGFLPRPVTRRPARDAAPVTYQPETWDAKQIARMVGA